MAVQMIGRGVSGRGIKPAPGLSARPAARITPGSKPKMDPNMYRKDLNLNQINALATSQGVNSKRIEDRIRRAGGNVPGMAAAPTPTASTPATPAATAAAPTSPLQNVNYSDPGSVLQAEMATNRFDQFNPYGSQTTSYDPVTGKSRVESKLSDPQQAILDRAQNNEIGTQDAYGNRIAAASQAMGQPLDFAGLQEVDTQNDATRQRAEQSFMARQRSQLDPMFKQQNDNQVRDFRARGIEFGSPQWQEQQGQLQDGQNRAYADAANQAVLSGGVEADRMFGNQSSLRTQQGNERLTQRAVPLSELSQVNALRQGVTNPAFQATSNIDVAGTGMGYAQIEAQKAAQQAGFSQENSMLRSTQKFNASQNAKDRANQQALARMGGGGGGGGGGGMDPIAKAQALSDLNFEEMKRLEAYKKANAPKAPSMWGQVASMIGSGLGQVIPAAIGGYFTNKKAE